MPAEGWDRKTQYTPHFPVEDLHIAELVERANDLTAMMRRLLDECAAGERGLGALEKALWAACLHNRILDHISRLIDASRYSPAATAAARRLASYEREVTKTIEKLAAARIAAVREARARSAAARGGKDRQAWRVYLGGSAEGAAYPEIKPHTTGPEHKAEETAIRALHKLRPDNLPRSALSLLWFGEEDTLSCKCQADFPSPPWSRADPSMLRRAKSSEVRAIR